MKVIAYIGHAEPNPCYQVLEVIRTTPKNHLVLEYGGKEYRLQPVGTSWRRHDVSGPLEASVFTEEKWAECVQSMEEKKLQRLKEYEEQQEKMRQRKVIYNQRMELLKNNYYVDPLKTINTPNGEVIYSAEVPVLMENDRRPYIYAVVKVNALREDYHYSLAYIGAVGSGFCMTTGYADTVEDAIWSALHTACFF